MSFILVIASLYFDEKHKGFEKMEIIGMKMLMKNKLTYLERRGEPPMIVWRLLKLLLATVGLPGRFINDDRRL